MPNAACCGCTPGPIWAGCVAWTAPWPPNCIAWTRAHHPLCWWRRPCWHTWRGAAIPVWPCRRWPRHLLTGLGRQRPRCGPRRLACPPCGRTCLPAQRPGWRPCRRHRLLVCAWPARLTLGSPWCWGAMRKPLCFTCAVTVFTKSGWAKTCCNAPKMRCPWTKLWRGCGWTAFLAKRWRVEGRRRPCPIQTRPPRRRPTGKSWPAPWLCVRIYRSSPGDRARAKPTPLHVCWLCCLLCTKALILCAWHWQRPRARPPPDSSSRLTARSKHSKGNH